MSGRSEQGALAGEILAGDVVAERGRAKLVKDGDEFVVHVSCAGCGAAQELRSAEEPNRLALGIANLMLCSGCTADDDRRLEQKALAEKRSARVSAADIPPSLVGLKWDDMLGGSPRRVRAIESARKWAEQPQSYVAPGLYLYGDVGVGKTRLAATAAWTRLSHSPIRWVSVAVLMAKLSAAWGDADRREALQVLTGSGAVVLDDLDKVNPTENARAQLYAAINERIDARAPMIVTANSKLSAIGDRLGEAIMSRLAGHCTQLELDGPDRRLELIPGGKS